MGRQAKCHGVILKTVAFRLRAKRFLLTYPQCNLSKEDLLNGIQQQCPGLVFDYYIARERHEDGNPHLHAYLRFQCQFESRDQRCFDVQHFHPNIQVARSEKKSIAYVKKDGEYITNVNETTNSDNKPNWSEILGTSTTSEDFLQAIRTNYAREYVLHYDRIRYFAEVHFQPARQPYVSAHDVFRIPEELADWIRSEFTRPRRERPRSCYLVGPSRTGKTVWARSLGDHCYWNTMYNLDDLIKPNIDYIVMDDIPYDRFPAFKGFVGAQQTFTMTDRYRKKHTIQWNGRPCIICINKDMEYENHLNQDELRWFRDNTVKIHVQNKLY